MADESIVAEKLESENYTTHFFTLTFSNKKCEASLTLASETQSLAEPSLASVPHNNANDNTKLLGA